MKDSRHQPFPEFFDAFVSLRGIDGDPRTWAPATVTEWRAVFNRWMNAPTVLDYTPAPAASHSPMAEDEAAAYLHDGVPPLRHTDTARNDVS